MSVVELDAPETARRIAEMERELDDLRRWAKAAETEIVNQTSAHLAARAEMEAARKRLTQLELERLTFLHIDCVSDPEDDSAIIKAGLLADRDDLGAHIEALHAIQRICLQRGVASQTTRRFRREVLYFLLDNQPRGPIIEVGTLHGGMTAAFAYVAAITGRRVYAIDIDPKCQKRTEETVALFGISEHVTTSDGDIDGFLRRQKNLGRLDLVFLDSAHDYKTTLAELQAIHRHTTPPPRAIALHDYSYRHAKQADFFDDVPGKNPVAVDLAVRDFLKASATNTQAPILKRIGEYSGDGIVRGPDHPGEVLSDFVERYGTEGIMLIYS